MTTCYLTFRHHRHFAAAIDTHASVQQHQTAARGNFLLPLDATTSDRHRNESWHEKSCKARIFDSSSTEILSAGDNEWARGQFSIECDGESQWKTLPTSCEYWHWYSNFATCSEVQITFFRIQLQQTSLALSLADRHGQSMWPCTWRYHRQWRMSYMCSGSRMSWPVVTSFHAIWWENWRQTVCWLAWNRKERNLPNLQEDWVSFKLNF